MNLGLVLCLRKARNFRLQESKRCRIVNFIWSTLLQISPNYVIIGTSHNAANFRLLHRPTRGCCLRVLFFFLLSLSSNPQLQGHIARYAQSGVFQSILTHSRAGQGPGIPTPLSCILLSSLTGLSGPSTPIAELRPTRNASLFFQPRWVARRDAFSRGGYVRTVLDLVWARGVAL